MKEALEQGHTSGDGNFSRLCSELIEKTFAIKKVLLTPSCTAALEMAAILLDLDNNSEIICPSFTFVTTANSFVLRGASPVFVDIRPDTLNIDESKIEERISNATKAIWVVHYGGVSCDMDPILEIAARHKLIVIEDAAHGVNASYRGRHLGSIGSLGAFSFHETKNYICGEGGALLINEESYIERAEIVRQKGTNRNQFYRGETDKYTWCDLGSSYVLSDILAAFLYAQLQHLNEIQTTRDRIYNKYWELLSPLQDRGDVKLPTIPSDCKSNHHLFYVIFDSEKTRNRVMDGLKQKSILSVFHYVPLHTSPAGLRYGLNKDSLPVTEDINTRLLRLPFYNSLTDDEISFVTSSLRELM